MPKIKREYTIDLSEPPTKRWQRMICKERGRAQRLIATAVKQAETLASKSTIHKAILKVARAIVPVIYRIYGDHEHAADMRAWAEGADIDLDDIVFANLSYELFQAAACTAVALNHPKNGVVHVRNMDWPLTHVGPYTCIIHYEGACGPFTTVGWPGWVGVLSGVAPGRFSATINQAPKVGMPSPGLLGDRWPAALALRHNFENSSTYDEIVDDLLKTKMVASTLFMVTGTERNQAVVIEHTGTTARKRSMRNGVLALANHYQARDLKEHNDGDDDDSRKRHCHAGTVGGAGCSCRTLSELLKLLGDEPVLHGLTAQRMVFVPSTGAFLAHYCDTDRAVLEHEKSLLSEDEEVG